MFNATIKTGLSKAALKKGLKKKKKDRDDDGDDDGDDVMTFDKLTNKQKNDYEERKKKALGSPVRFRVSSVLISGISLGLADLVNDIMGGDKSLGDCSPALIDKIVITRFDFRNKAVHTKKLLQTLVYKTDLINIIKDLALQIGIAAGDKVRAYEGEARMLKLNYSTAFASRSHTHSRSLSLSLPPS